MIKIAIPTDDKLHISEHTGRATFFAIATIEDGNMAHLEFRENPQHHHEPDEAHSHAETVAMIKDCDIILVRKIGKYLNNELKAEHKKIALTTSTSIGEGIKRYLSMSG